MTVHFSSILVSPTTSILETIKVIDPSTMQMALVTDGKHHLLGMVTDGDIRRSILKGIGLDQPIEKIMNKSPTTASIGDSHANVIALMRQVRIRAMPVVTPEGILIDLILLDDNKPTSTQTYDNPVVIMAGGKGTRLAPLTYDLPKPMIPVGGIPLLETTLTSFIKQGFHQFFISVNYKADIIRNHFGDGSRFGVEINYLEENISLGTGGALSLLPQTFDLPIIVMNGDILTSLPFAQLIEFHQQNHAKGTMCVREQQIQISYGVVRASGIKFRGLMEKPTKNFFVNTGIYVIESSVLDLIPSNIPYGMTDLFNQMIKRGDDAIVFPIREYWMDIGHHADLALARSDYMEFFGDKP